MSETYRIQYQTENSYQYPVREAVWQFLIIPETNTTQNACSIHFENSLGIPWELSETGFGFPCIRLRNTSSLQYIQFRAEFELVKETVNPFSFDPGILAAYDPGLRFSLPFRMEFDRFLKTTPLTRIPQSPELLAFDPDKDLLENLMRLNQWVYHSMNYTQGLTHVDSTLEEILRLKSGVCQDFAHLFIALCRQQGIPARYVSGYLHQGLGYFGDSQMHAWAEAYVPGVGWVGFDPTNNLLTATDHIKVTHGRDYADCAPLKGIVVGSGTNESQHSVRVATQQ